MKRFWLVWRVNGSAPTVPHDSLESARREAERLARTHRGERFAVMESQASVVVSDVQWVDAVDEPELPW